MQPYLPFYQGLLEKLSLAELAKSSSKLNEKKIAHNQKLCKTTALKQFPNRKNKIAFFCKKKPFFRENFSDLFSHLGISNSSSCTSTKAPLDSHKDSIHWLTHPMQKGENALEIFCLSSLQFPLFA